LKRIKALQEIVTDNDNLSVKKLKTCMEHSLEKL
jgi:hypothetical protein